MSGKAHGIVPSAVKSGTKKFKKSKGGVKMSTRGAYGFYKSGITKATYNHSDSYPSGLGRSVMEFIKETSIEEMNEIFNNIVLVNEDDLPSLEQIKEVAKITDVEIYDTINWYSLLRSVQGDLSAYKKGLRYMNDNQEFLKNSAFCEWAYIINLDENVLEVYKGSQKKPQKNRYYTKEPCCNCYNVALIKKIPIEEIKKGNIEELISRIEKEK
ncbi:hypothetical protein [Thermoanaerobacter pentosaceus]|uniref:Uncharacterized protein n=1 Tax=Thermoanaerobacter pentosaceus TaxID=694059 RepID=A0ABT9M2N2_9THEO|nr:hypothetical protein [Thermoanaerobacter pentosaceus]MDP9750391.1 hypothetical protein [Thermoanaerobacter pentosaceus]